MILNHFGIIVLFNNLVLWLNKTGLGEVDLHELLDEHSMSIIREKWLRCRLTRITVMSLVNN